MPSRSGGPFATLLMFIPLIAVPLLAVFGVPKFPSLNASPTNGSEDDFFSEPDWQTESGDQSSHDVFAAVDAGSRFSDTPPFQQGTDGGEPVAYREDVFAENSSADWDLPSDALDGWSLESNESGEPPVEPEAEASLGEPTADEFAFAPESEPRSASGPNAEQLTWQSAVKRLRVCGIEQFQLQPGHQPDLFHFSCLLEPPANPRVMHRFEAESANPLDAVEDVVTQIETWLDRR